MQVGFIGIIGDELNSDPADAARRAVELGYAGIEDPKIDDDQWHHLKDAGLRVLTIGTLAHELEDKADELIDQAVRTGVDRVTCWWGPADSREVVTALAQSLNKLGRRLVEKQITLAYHHHDHEFRNAFDGVTAFDLLVAETDPATVRFNIDIAWAQIGGVDPAALIDRLGRRVVSLHVKDAVGPVREADRSVRWTVLGTGDVAIRPALEAAERAGVELLVVEQDALNRLDGWKTLTASRLYLAELGY